jgi:hypothetical protein
MSEIQDWQECEAMGHVGPVRVTPGRLGLPRADVKRRVLGGRWGPRSATAAARGGRRGG